MRIATLASAALAAGLLFGSVTAKAQSAPPGWVQDGLGVWHQEPVASESVTTDIPISRIDLSALGATPLIMVLNTSGHPVTGLDCVNWTTTPMSIPNGILSNGYGAIIAFGASKCSRTILIHFGPRTYRLDGFDISSNTKLDLSPDFYAAAR